MSRLFLVLLLLPQSGELESRFRKLLPRLAADSPQEREAAHADLAAFVAKNRRFARQILRDTLPVVKEAEVRAVLLDALDRTRSLEDVSLEAVFPRESLTVREAGSSNTRFRMRVRNGDEDELVVVRDFAPELLDPDGKRVETCLCIGAGLRPSGCFLEASTFLVIPPGHVIEWEESLAAYRGQARVLQGWQPARAGTHVLRFTLAFDREAFRKRCRDGCATHGLPDRPWNRAVEGSRSFETRLVLREESAEEKAAVARHEAWMKDLMDRYRAKRIGLAELFDAVEKAKLDQRDRQRVLSVTRD
jgi:hypothetical protein